MANKSIYFLALRPNLLEEAQLLTHLNSWAPGMISKKSNPFFIQVSDLFQCSEDSVFDLGKEFQKFAQLTNSFSLNFHNLIIQPLKEEVLMEVQLNDQISSIHAQITKLIRENRTIERTPQFSITPHFHMTVISKGECLMNFSSICNALNRNFKSFSYNQDTISLMEFNGQAWCEKFFFPLCNKSRSAKSISSKPIH